MCSIEIYTLAALAFPFTQAWVSHTSDPLISPDAQAVIAAIASHPACLPSLAAAAAPTLAGILSNGAAARQAKRQGLQPAAAAAGGGDEAPMLVEASLDLLGTLLQPNQPAVAMEVRTAPSFQTGFKVQALQTATICFAY
jgi:hypothetical protein